MLCSRHTLHVSRCTSHAARIALHAARPHVTCHTAATVHRQYPPHPISLQRVNSACSTLDESASATFDENGGVVTHRYRDSHSAATRHLAASSAASKGEGEGEARLSRGSEFSASDCELILETGDEGSDDGRHTTISVRRSSETVNELNNASLNDVFAGRSSAGGGGSEKAHDCEAVRTETAARQSRASHASRASLGSRASGLFGLKSRSSSRKSDQDQGRGNGLYV